MSTEDRSDMPLHTQTARSGSGSCSGSNYILIPSPAPILAQAVWFLSNRRFDDGPFGASLLAIQPTYHQTHCRYIHEPFLPLDCRYSHPSLPTYLLTLSPSPLFNTTTHNGVGLIIPISSLWHTVLWILPASPIAPHGRAKVLTALHLQPAGPSRRGLTGERSVIQISAQLS